MLQVNAGKLGKRTSVVGDRNSWRLTVVLNLISQQVVPAKTRCGFMKSITSQGEQKLQIITGICVREKMNIKRSKLVISAF